MQAESPWTVLDTFAGAGGFSLGFELAGCEIVGAVEKDTWAAETYQLNHREVPVLIEDITCLDDACVERSVLRAPRIIIGGPPCQGYSVCRKNAGDPKDPRNSLFTEFLRMARIFGPEALVMENVPNITRARTADGRLVTDVIRKEFERLGYNVYSAILRASSCGVPQKRERFFCIASRKELITPFPSPTHLSKSTQMSVFDAPASLAQCPTLWDAISDLPVIEACEGSEVMDYSAAPQNKYQQWCRAGSPVMSVSFGLSGEDIKLQG